MKRDNKALKNLREQDLGKFAEDVAADVVSDFYARQKARRPYELSWQLNMNFVMGNQYCAIGARGAIEEEEKYFFWQEKQVFNHIAPIVETRLSRLNRVRPRPVVRPFSGSDADVNSAKLATKILDSVRDSICLDELTRRATSWSEVCGTVFYKVSWDAKKNDAVVSVCSPFEIYPDSNVASDVEECRSLIHAKVYPAKEVKETWGVDVAGETLRVFSFDSVMASGGLGYNSAVPSVTQESKPDQVLVIERYTRPSAEYPRGKLEMVAGGVLAYFGELPYFFGEDSPCFPFVRQISSEQAGCFWGASVVERVIPVQRAYNAVKNRKQEFLNRLSMGVLTVEDGSVDTDSLEEEGLSPGKILVYRKGANKPVLMDNGAVPSEFNEEEDRLLQEFVTVSGVSEFARNSKTPAAVTSGVALQLIAEQDDIRLASSIDSVKSATKNIAKQILRLYKAFVSEAKLMRFHDGISNAETFYFCGSDLGSDDVVFETENELTDTPATRRTMLFDLLAAGVLYDKDGKLSAGAKSKILTLMGFGNWENAQDVAATHADRAAKENSEIEKAEVLPVDDHAIHIEEHTKYVVSRDLETMKKGVLEKFLNHIEQHKKFKEEKENV